MIKRIKMSGVVIELQLLWKETCCVISSEHSELGADKLECLLYTDCFPLYGILIARHARYVLLRCVFFQVNNRLNKSSKACCNLTPRQCNVKPTPRSYLLTVPMR